MNNESTLEFQSNPNRYIINNTTLTLLGPCPVAFPEFNLFIVSNGTFKSNGHFHECVTAL